MATREEMIAFIKAKKAEKPSVSSAPSREEMINFIKQKKAQLEQAPQEKPYDYSNFGQVAKDLGQQAVIGLKQAPEAVGSAIGETIAGPLGSGVGGAIGQAASEAASGVVEAVKDPKKFIEDLGRLPTKEQVIDQVNKYLTTFGLNVAAPAVARQIGKAAAAAPSAAKKLAEDLAEKATGATAVQAQKFKKGAGRELLDRGIVKFGQNPEETAKIAAAQVSKAESTIDSALKSLDEKGVKVKVDDVVQKISSEIESLKKDPSQSDIVKRLSSIVEDIKATGDEFVNVSAAEKTKRGFNKIAGNWLDPEKGQAGKIAYRAYRDAVETVAAKEAPEIAKSFKEAKQTYGLLSPIQEASERRAQQLKQSPIGGLLDTAAAGGVGASVGGVEGLAAGVAAAAARKAIAPRIASSSAVTLNEVSKALEKTPQYTKLLRDNPAQFTALVKAVYDSYQENQKPKFPLIVRKNGQKAVIKNEQELKEAKSEGWR